MFIKERELFSWVKLGRDTVIAALAFAYSVWAIWGSGQEWLAKGFMLLLFGIPVYVWMKWRRRAAEIAHRERIEREAFSLQRSYVPPPKPRVPVSTNLH